MACPVIQRVQGRKHSLRCNQLEIVLPLITNTQPAAENGEGHLHLGYKS